MNKLERLAALAQHRKAARWPGYRQVEEFHDGAYASAHVSPYTKSAANPDAQLFLMLQDWASEAWCAGPVKVDAARLGHSPTNATNRNLFALLREFFDLGFGDTYATNLFPFVKPGPMNAPIPASALVAAAQEYALPQVRIVRPRVVVAFGLVTFRALQQAAGLRPAATIGEAIATPWVLDSHTLVYCQSHPGPLGRMNRNRGGVDRVSADWAAMRDAIAG